MWLCIRNDSYTYTSGLLDVSSCKMFTSCDVMHETEQRHVSSAGLLVGMDHFRVVSSVTWPLNG